MRSNRIKDYYDQVKQNRLLFALLITACVVAVADLAYMGYIIAMMVMLSKGVALYESTVTAISIAALSLNGVFAVLTILFFVFRKK